MHDRCSTKGRKQIREHIPPLLDLVEGSAQVTAAEAYAAQAGLAAPRTCILISVFLVFFCTCLKACELTCQLSKRIRCLTKLDLCASGSSGQASKACSLRGRSDCAQQRNRIAQHERRADDSAEALRVRRDQGEWRMALLGWVDNGNQREWTMAIRLSGVAGRVLLKQTPPTHVHGYRDF